MGETRRKRGNGEGSVRQRPDGTWEARISLSGGKRKSLYAKTRAELREKQRRAERDADAGLILGAGRQTIAQFLERWLTDAVKPNRAAKTHAGYADIVRLHLAPAPFGSRRLDALTPQHVAALLRAKQDAGLHPGTVHHIRAALRAALNHAGRWGLVGRNVAALVESPRRQPVEVVPMNAAEARARLDATAWRPCSTSP